MPSTFPLLSLLSLLCLLPHHVYAAAPKALHQLVEAEVGGEKVVKLVGKDDDGDKLVYTISSLPTVGSLHQLSSVFSSHGYEPKLGPALSPGDVVSDGKNRVLYVRSTPDREPGGEMDRFEYTVADASVTSGAATVVLTGPSHHLARSDFSKDADSWVIAGNRAPSSATHEASSRGGLNHYIHGADDTLNMIEGTDKDLWGFQAPAKFLGYQGLAYGGSLEFTLGSFSGDFSAGNLNQGLNGQGLNLVTLHCSSCGLNTGVTLAYPLDLVGFSGATKTFQLPLTETGGWLQDPENTLHSWSAPTKCMLIEVLSSLTSLTIQGDFTKWYEAVSLDDVRFTKKNAASAVPLCAQGSPDASSCTC